MPLHAHVVIAKVKPESINLVVDMYRDKLAKTAREKDSAYRSSMLLVDRQEKMVISIGFWEQRCIAGLFDELFAQVQDHIESTGEIALPHFAGHAQYEVEVQDPPVSA